MVNENMKNTPGDKDIENNKVIAAMSYLWILCLVPLFLRRGSKFAQFHAKQGLMLFIVEIIGWLIFWIPVIGWLLIIILIVFAVMGIVMSLDGKFWEMPILGKYAAKINLDIKD